MIHIRIDKIYDTVQTFVCGITELPPGDKYFFSVESAASRLADCPVCNPRQLDTPLPNKPDYGEFCRIGKQ